MSGSYWTLHRPCGGVAEVLAAQATVTVGGSGLGGWRLPCMDKGYGRGMFDECAVVGCSRRGVDQMNEATRGPPSWANTEGVAVAI